MRKIFWIMSLGFYGVAAPCLWIGNKLQEISMRKAKEIGGTMRTKRQKERPELEALLNQVRERVAKMTPEEIERMEQQQRQSWARQDMD